MGVCGADEMPQHICCVNVLRNSLIAFSAFQKAPRLPVNFQPRCNEGESRLNNTYLI